MMLKTTKVGTEPVKYFNFLQVKVGRYIRIRELGRFYT